MIGGVRWVLYDWWSKVDVIWLVE